MLSRVVTGAGGNSTNARKSQSRSCEYGDIVDAVAPFTMTSRERIVALCDAVKFVTEHKIPGAFVECGVWRGGSVMAMLKLMVSLGISDREIYLFDTFEGMPPPSDVDHDSGGQNARQLLEAAEKATSMLWAYCTLDDVKQNIRLVEYDFNLIHFVKGLVENTLPDHAPNQVALLRLDTDWYQSTYHELQHLFPRLSANGVLILDDYGHWMGARRAVDKYIKENQLRLLLQRIDYTGRMAVKLS